MNKQKIKSLEEEFFFQKIEHNKIIKFKNKYLFEYDYFIIDLSKLKFKNEIKNK